MRDSYVARWRGHEYEAAPDGMDIRLYHTDQEDGFSQVRAGRYVRVVAADEVEDFCYVRTTCQWRGEPFIVLGEHEGWLRVEYTGGKAPVAASLGLEEFEYGVYQGWVHRNEVTDLREYRV